MVETEEGISIPKKSKNIVNFNKFSQINTSWNEYVPDLKSEVKIELVEQPDNTYLIRALFVPNPNYKAEKEIRNLNDVNLAILELKNAIMDQKPMKGQANSYINFNKLSYITKEKGGYCVKSEKGKNLGGPYKTKEQAKRRLHQIEYFKHKNKKGGNMSFVNFKKLSLNKFAQEQEMGTFFDVEIPEESDFARKWNMLVNQYESLPSPKLEEIKRLSGNPKSPEYLAAQHVLDMRKMKGTRSKK